MKRIAFYLFWDKDGIVDRYVPYCLEKLREHVDHIVVISNGALGAPGRAMLEAVADDVWERENVGFDVWGYKEGLARFGYERLGEFDELILLNYTFFGPIFPFSEMFEKSEGWDVDFWGISEHGETRPHPFANKAVLPKHIQSHWFAVRKPMLTSDAFREYWDTMPMITSYSQSVDMHEARFAKHFNELGFTEAVLLREADYPGLNPILDDVVQLTGDRCPILKRRTFFHSPLYLSDHAIIGRDVIDVIEKTSDYPLDLVWENVARTAEPRVAATNFSLSRIYSDAPEIGPEALAEVERMRAAVVIHCFYVDMIDEIMDLVEYLPCERHVVITTDTERKQNELEEALRRRSETSFQVRVVESNAGRDVSAFLITCADVLRDDSYDVVVKLHSKRSPQDGEVAGNWFKRHLFGNLLHSRNYAASVLNLLREKPGVGMAIPPVIHIGYPTLGKAWFGNKKLAADLCKRMGITTPLDESTPLSTYGSMFIARPAALRRLVDAGFGWSDFESEYADGSLAHVIERLFTYSSLGSGMPVYTVQSTELASINYTFLEYKLQNFSQNLPGTVMQQRAYLDAVEGVPNLLGMGKGMLDLRYPKLGQALRPLYRLGRRGFRTVKAAGIAARGAVKRADS